MLAMRRLKGSRPGAPSRGVIAAPRPSRLVRRSSGTQPGAAGSDPTDNSPKFVKQIFKNLQDFGIGKSSFSEAGVGLFLSFGTAAAIALLAWARGTAMRTGEPYKMTVELPLACGVLLGTPVRIRGVQVGQVQDVKSNLERVEVTCEINDISTVIPRNSKVQANQSGLIAEPLLDITPQLPLPDWKHGPLDPNCQREGLLVCQNGRIEGEVGVSLDDLVYIMTRMARKAEGDGYEQIFAAAEAATKAMEDSKPLLDQTQKLLEEVTPLLRELREAGVGDSIESLTRSAAEAVADIKDLQEAVLTDENVSALRKSVRTLCRTLENVESISSGVSRMTHDSSTQRNLRQLVSALSRLVDE